MVVEVPSPDCHCESQVQALLMFIPAPRTERRERRFVARDIRSGRSGVPGSIEAA